MKENPDSRIRAAYDSWSVTYEKDTNLTRDIDREVTRQALAGTHFNAILEIGCGTGKNTSLLAQIGKDVHAVDFSKGMLAKARERVQARNVRFIRVDLNRSWPFKAQAFNLVVCNLVLEHIADLSGVFAEAGRSLQPSGRFFVCELHPFRQYQGKQATFQQGERQVKIPAYTHHMSEYLEAAGESRLTLLELKEWWHPEDRDETPRLVSFMFEK